MPTTKSTAKKSSAPKAGKTSHPGQQAYDLGVKEAKGPGGKAGAADRCPYVAMSSNTKTAFRRDCYFAGANELALPPKPAWFDGAPD